MGIPYKYLNRNFGVNLSFGEFTNSATSTPEYLSILTTKRNKYIEKKRELDPSYEPPMIGSAKKIIDMRVPILFLFDVVLLKSNSL